MSDFIQTLKSSAAADGQNIQTGVLNFIVTINYKAEHSDQDRNSVMVVSVGNKLLFLSDFFRLTVEDVQN